MKLIEDEIRYSTCIRASPKEVNAGIAIATDLRLVYAGVKCGSLFWG